MLSRLMLVLVQCVVGWYAAIEIARALPRIGNLDIFLLAGVFALLVWAIGLLAATVLKDLAQPGPPALMFAFAVAVIFSALTVIPEARQAVTLVTGEIDTRAYPLVGAVIGYAVQS